MFKNMDKETKRTLLSILLGCVGGVLVGMNAGSLNRPVPAMLFVFGLAILALSPSILRLFFNKKK